MYKKLIPIILIFIVNLLANSNHKPKEIIYIFPAPDSKFISTQSTIIVKFDKKLAPQIAQSSVQFKVVGVKSGIHNGYFLVKIVYSNQIFTLMLPRK